MEYPETDDTEYEEYEIRAVDLDPPITWIVRLDHGFYVKTPRGHGNPQPKVGQTARVYGMLPHYYRGLFINGKKCFYQTAEAYKEQQDALQAEAVDEYKRVVLPKHDERMGKLPEPYRAWLANLREEEDIDVVMDREEDWVFVAEEANIFVTLLEAVADIDTVESILDNRTPDQGPGYKRVVEVMRFTRDTVAAKSIGLPVEKCPMPTVEQRAQIRAAADKLPEVSAKHDEDTLRYSMALARAFITDPATMVNVRPWPAYGLPPTAEAV